MANQTTTTQSGGLGVLGLLGCLFVALKLLGVIDWSWWWVTLPFWGGFAFVACIFIFILVVAVAVDARK